MEVIILPNVEEMSQLAAKRVAHQVKSKANSVLGLATGQTPKEVYKNLVAVHKQKGLDFSKVVTFNLDEYVGLSGEDPNSYFFYMRQNVIDPLEIPLQQFHIPSGMAQDIEAECERYEKTLHKHGPIDLQILGIGRDGHIGFNEPGSSLSSRTRLKTLSQVTRKDNASQFSQSAVVPDHVITMGIQTILEAREILLLASGEAKAEAVRQCVEGPISASCPASVLQFHAKTKVILDEGAASLLKNKAYYKEVYQKKPSWQKAEFV